MPANSVGPPSAKGHVCNAFNMQGFLPNNPVPVVQLPRVPATMTRGRDSSEGKGSEDRSRTPSEWTRSGDQADQWKSSQWHGGGGASRGRQEWKSGGGWHGGGWPKGKHAGGRGASRGGSDGWGRWWERDGKAEKSQRAPAPTTPKPPPEEPRMKPLLLFTLR